MFSIMQVPFIAELYKLNKHLRKFSNKINTSDFYQPGEGVRVTIKTKVWLKIPSSKHCCSCHLKDGGYADIAF